MDNLRQVLLVQLPVLVLVQLLKLFFKEPLVPVYRTVQKTRDKLCVINLATVVEVHGFEDLSDIVFL